MKSISPDLLEPDRLTCLIDPNVYIDANTRERVAQRRPLEINLPRMMDKDEARRLEITAKVVVETAAAVLVLNGLLQVLLGASLKAIWSVVNTLQFIVYFVEIKNLNLSAESRKVITILKMMVLGDFRWLIIAIKEKILRSDCE